MPCNEKQEVRPNWDEYFLSMAKVASTRSTCYRSKCGAVIVNDKVVISTGYNGAPQHQPNCLELANCPRNDDEVQSGTRLEYCRAVGSHAESNAIALAAKSGHPTDGATMYLYGHMFCCDQCKAQIANSGITRLVHKKQNGRTVEYVPSRDWTTHPIDL